MTACMKHAAENVWRVKRVNMHCIHGCIIM